MPRTAIGCETLYRRAIQARAGIALKGSGSRSVSRRPREPAVPRADVRDGSLSACPVRPRSISRASIPRPPGGTNANQPTRARSRTIRRLLVRASSRSIAAEISFGGGSVDQRLPTRWIWWRRSSFCSRASVLSLLRPAARATIAVENESGILRSAAWRRSGRLSVRRSRTRGFGEESGSEAAGAGCGAGWGLRPTGESSPSRARQLPHKTTGSRSAGGTISKRRHPRPARQTPQRRPARSISVRSLALIGFRPSS